MNTRFPEHSVDFIRDGFTKKIQEEIVGLGYMDEMLDSTYRDSPSPLHTFGLAEPTVTPRREGLENEVPGRTPRREGLGDEVPGRTITPRREGLEDDVPERTITPRREGVVGLGDEVPGRTPRREGLEDEVPGRTVTPRREGVVGLEDEVPGRTVGIRSATPTTILCMYSITYPFYVEGMPSSGEATNIYGRVFPKYDTYYPCLQWIATNELKFPSMNYEYSALFTNNDSDEKSQETILFENEIHTFFLSFFKEEVYSTDILSTAYKGISYDESTHTTYAFYDFSPIYDLLKNTNLLVLSEELKDEPIFTKYPFLKKIEGYPSPTLLYMCIYDNEKQDYVNVDVNMEYRFPLEHPLLGCTAYYFTEAPLDPNVDVSKLVRFACIQSRIMYEVRIEDGDVLYMGENVGDFKEDFEMGLLMCSTLHFEEKGHRFIAIKQWTHIHPLR